MVLLERLWLRLTFRRRPRIRHRLSPFRRTYGGLSDTEVAWVDAIRPLFDTRYYLHAHPDVRHSPLSAAAHYVREGHALGYNPAPWFCDEGYLADHRDVAASGMPAFVHYALYGRNEGRLITPTADISPSFGATPIAQVEPVAQDG